MSILINEQVLGFAYIVSVVLFILAIKWLSSPVSARHGVLAGEIAAALAAQSRKGTDDPLVRHLAGTELVLDHIDACGVADAHQATEANAGERSAGVYIGHPGQPQ